jgi:y4mF family transcriptional regulator
MKQKNRESFLTGFVRFSRNRLKLTQEELAIKAGVGLRFVRELEQGKSTLRMDKVNQVLSLFGYSLLPGNLLNPFQILETSMNVNLRIDLKNKSVLFGYIVDAVRSGSEIIAWKFVSTGNHANYLRDKSDAFIMNVQHADIINIEIPQ